MVPAARHPVERKLLAARFAGGVAPRYDGYGIANLPASVLRPFNARATLPPLAPDVLPPALLAGVERVVALVVDGLGWRQLLRAMDSGGAPNLRALADRGHLAPATSVLPSTTVTALATLSTGESPVRHGLLGYRMWLPRPGITANMIRFMGILGGRLEDRGFDLEAMLPFPTIFEKAARAGAEACVVTRDEYTRSPLGRLIYRGALLDGYQGQGDLFVKARRHLERLEGRPALLRLYWDLVDTVAHEYGETSDEHAAEVAAFDFALGREFFDRIRDPKTLLVVTADHGHITIPPDRRVRLNEHPGLLENLAVPPSGEGRMSYLHVRDGRRRAVVDYVRRRLAKQATLVPVERAANDGRFGPGKRHPEFERRAGEFLLVARDDHKFDYHYAPDAGPRPLAGNHGGVSPEEMLVPVLAARMG
ncbi:MAG TPA: alkaline phosphatase family protein [Candidatus Thermoplasmatota archaeon]|nr:alkaline phosphatase family protein [Candidatus Thermoplasmatota archaeon]